MKPIAVERSIAVSAPAAAAFSAAVSGDVPAIFRKAGPAPGVSHVGGHEGPWSAPGQTRILLLTDGRSARETLESLRLNESFAYRMEDLEGPFALLVKGGRSEWRFFETKPGETRVEWRTDFHPASAFVAPIARAIVGAIWPRFMEGALERVKLAAEPAAR